MSGWGGIGRFVAAGLAVAIPLVAAQNGGTSRSESPANPRALEASSGMDAPAFTREQNSRAGSTRPKNAAANPLAPFLERWLSVRDSAGRKIAATAPRSSPAGDRAAAPLVPERAPPVVLSPGAKSSPANPYLEAMVASAPVATTDHAPPSDSAPSAPPPSLAPSPATDEARVVAPTLTAPEAPERRPDPAYRPPPSRDAKYFPQQKRF